MHDEAWAAVDALFDELRVEPDAALDAALQSSAEHGLPAIQVAPNQGKMHHLPARAINARTVLEIGTLGGYSTIWLARALPPDRLVSGPLARLPIPSRFRMGGDRAAG